MLDDYIKMLLVSKDYSYLMCYCFYDYFVVNFLDELDKKFDGNIQINQENGTFMISYNGTKQLKIISSCSDNFNQIEIVNENQRILFKENNSLNKVLIEGENYCEKESIAIDFDGGYDGVLDLSLSGTYKTEIDFETFYLTNINTFEELKKELGKSRNNDKVYLKKYGR